MRGHLICRRRLGDRARRWGISMGESAAAYRRAMAGRDIAPTLRYHNGTTSMTWVGATSASAEDEDFVDSLHLREHHAARPRLPLPLFRVFSPAAAAAVSW